MKRYFSYLSFLESCAHSYNYPTYKYNPRKSRENKFVIFEHGQLGVDTFDSSAESSSNTSTTFGNGTVSTFVSSTSEPGSEAIEQINYEATPEIALWSNPLFSSFPASTSELGQDNAVDEQSLFFVSNGTDSVINYQIESFMSVENAATFEEWDEFLQFDQDCNFLGTAEDLWGKAGLFSVSEANAPLII